MALFSKKPAAIIDTTAEEHVLTSPLTGKVVPMTEVPDEVFSAGVLGGGVAIEPSVGNLYSPVDGVISNLADTLHAVGITTDSNSEILIHVGMDTVNMDSKGFKAYCKNGDKVKRGQLLLTFNVDAIKKAGYSTVTPICVTSGHSLEVIPQNGTEIEAGAPLLELDMETVTE
jgi:PTS system beta-glucosides-specific IIC component